MTTSPLRWLLIAAPILMVVYYGYVSLFVEGLKVIANPPPQPVVVTCAGTARVNTTSIRLDRAQVAREEAQLAACLNAHNGVTAIKPSDNQLTVTVTGIDVNNGPYTITRTYQIVPTTTLPPLPTPTPTTA